MTCPPCRDLIDRWINDTKPSTHIRPGLTIASHATYDDTPAGSEEARRFRHREWAALVRSQRDAIKALCAREHQVGQQSLFDLKVAS